MLAATSATAPQAFDYYGTYSDIRERVEDAVRKVGKPREQIRVLVVGVGRSRLPDQMQSDGFARRRSTRVAQEQFFQSPDAESFGHITCIDTDAALIAARRTLVEDFSPLRFLEMDVRKLDLPSEGFDLVVDKALADFLAQGPDSFESMFQMNKEIWRVLVPGGVFLSISWAPPETRAEHLARKGLYWKVDHNVCVAHAGQEERLYHCYTAHKERRKSSSSSSSSSNSSSNSSTNTRTGGSRK